jgi:hypothetical protein
MVSTRTNSAAKSNPEQLVAFGKDQAEAMLNAQKDLFEVYEEAGHTWLSHVKLEVDLWSKLATKLAGTRSAPEALGAYQESVTQWMQLATEDGKRLFDECQKVAQIVAQSASSGWRSPGSSL